MSTTNEKYREDLTAYLLEVASGNGYLKGTLLNTPDLAEAYRFFLISVEVMYKMGAAIWLNKLGYKFEKVNLV